MLQRWAGGPESFRALPVKSRGRPCPVRSKISSNGDALRPPRRRSQPDATLHYRRQVGAGPPPPPPAPVTRRHPATRQTSCRCPRQIPVTVQHVLRTTPFLTQLFLFHVRDARASKTGFRVPCASACTGSLLRLVPYVAAYQLSAGTIFMPLYAPAQE